MVLLLLLMMVGGVNKPKRGMFLLWSLVLTPCAQTVCSGFDWKSLRLVIYVCMCVRVCV